MNGDLLRHWALDPEITYLNHGAFGACPLPVLAYQSELRARLEREPTHFMDSELEARLDDARQSLAAFVHARPQDLAFVPNATTGVNTILRSLEFREGDEILATDHEYNACVNAIRFVADKQGAKTVIATVPLPLATSGDVVDAVLAAVTPRTRLAVISHVTSPTGLVFPVERLVAELSSRGIDSLIDGAHAPGMLDLDLTRIGAAYYTGNCHKWINSPKGSAFLHVREDRQSAIRPLVISHGANTPRTERSRYLLESDWTGTGDPTPYLCIPAALDFMGGLFPGGWSQLRAENRIRVLTARELLDGGLGNTTPLAPAEMIGALAAVELPGNANPSPQEPPQGVDDDATYPLDPLHDVLFAEKHIDVPVFAWPHTPAYSAQKRRLLRVSAQAYNSADDYERLAAALAATI